jgi:hypothetical protein
MVIVEKYHLRYITCGKSKIMYSPVLAFSTYKLYL